MKGSSHKNIVNIVNSSPSNLPIFRATEFGKRRLHRRVPITYRLGVVSGWDCWVL